MRAQLPRRLMTGAYAIQQEAIDIASWEADAEFSIYPQGARSKQAVFAPDGVPGFLLPGRRYLFKESQPKYPDQYLTEVAAYRIGRLIDVNVPPAFAAFDSRTGVCGALIQWFYTDGVERFVWAGDLLQNIRPTFDRKKGRDHNLKDISKLLLGMRIAGALHASEDWRQWWAEALLLDALLGNTDRHQDNWGFLYAQELGGTNDRARLCPYFDNGTSMGHERFTNLVSGWTDDQLDRYIAKGTHHVRWEHGGVRLNHCELLRKALLIWPRTRPAIELKASAIAAPDLAVAVESLTQLNLPVPMSPQRSAFMLRLLTRRLAHIKDSL